MKKRQPDIKQSILALMRGPKYQPLSERELIQALSRKGERRHAVADALVALERSGKICRIRKNRFILPEAADLITGTIQIHQAGFGFVAREESDEADVYLSAENTGTAMNGDRVVVRISGDADRGRRRSGKGPEGRVIRILERAHETIVGTLQQSRN